MTKLPGIGRKTANLVCGDIFGQPAVVVDTHCIRTVSYTHLLRFLEEGSSAPSKSGAKVRPKGVADAHTVDIP